MPRKTKTAAAAARPLPKIPKELIDQFVSGPMSAQAVNKLSIAFKKTLIERALGAELGHHLGYAEGHAKPETASKHRNGSSAKTVLTEDGPVRIEVPRDREGSFEPLLIPKHERRFTGFDDRIVAMYARGMSGKHWSLDGGRSSAPRRLGVVLPRRSGDTVRTRILASENSRDFGVARSARQVLNGELGTRL